jgi:hypothetical protein
MSDDKESSEFYQQMDLFLRNSPLIPPPIPTRCEDCTEFHIIADDLVYCVTCHYPIAGEPVKLETAKQELRQRGILSRLFRR